MEKINTPLGEVYEKLKSAKKLADKRKDSEHWKARSIQIDSTIKLVESLLQTERDMIVNLKKQQYMEGYNEEISLKLAENYFTQTFKSYE